VRWAVYGQLPAQGLGIRDPLRPYATGGLGAGVFVLLPGPEGEIIVVYGSPVLEYIEAILPDADLNLAVGIAQADLTWIRALETAATTVYATSPRMASLLAAESHPAAIWRVEGPYAPQVAAGIITAALTGAEVPHTYSTASFIDDLQAALTGASNADYEPTLYAGKVLSSQES
jgi:hypothetical protein